jgi:hypothetical protein
MGIPYRTPVYAQRVSLRIPKETSLPGTIAVRMTYMLNSCEPEIRESAIGWLATTPSAHEYRIGTVGRTRQEAVDRFHSALDAWRELHGRTEEAN